MKKKKRYSSLLIIILVLALTVIITRGFSHARYASNAVFNYYLSSKGFYFESDDLSFDTKSNVDTMWDGEKVYFTLSNSDNGALSSETDIVYTVSCIVDEEDTTKQCLLNGTGKSEINATLSASFGCSDSTYKDEDSCIINDKKWTATPATSDVYFEVVDTSGEEVLNANVLVKVTSSKPYKKELSGRYNLIRDNSEIGELSMKYEEGSIKSSLIVTNSYNENKCVAVSWDSLDFIYDINSKDVLGKETDSEGNINCVYFMLDKMDSTVLEFYEKDKAASYNELSFNLVESNMCE